MKSEKKILAAFLLNTGFAAAELIGGAFTGSVAILSDAIHDMGDGLSIGLSFFLEKKSKKRPDEAYTFGYRRYSVLGAAITDLILLIGSLFVIYKGIVRLVNPIEIDENGMIVFALLGFLINFVAALFTRGGDSLNQKAVNLHMLEDVLGWAVVLIGSVIIRFTNLYIIDPIMSIGVAVFIFVHAVSGIREIIMLFLEKIPEGIDAEKIKKHLLEIEGVKDVHHLHIRSIDGKVNSATLHIVADSEAFFELKRKIRGELREHGIEHITIETETDEDECENTECRIYEKKGSWHHGHHH